MAGSGQALKTNRVAGGFGSGKVLEYSIQYVWVPYFLWGILGTSRYLGFTRYFGFTRNVGYYPEFQVTCYTMIFGTDSSQVSKKMSVGSRVSGTRWALVNGCCKHE